MFVVFTADGTQTIRGRPCFVWQGIPDLDDILDCIGDKLVLGMLIEVSDLGLPIERSTMYSRSDMISRDDIWASYDGRTLTVGRSMRSRTTDPEILRSALATTHHGMCELYFDIVHGQAENKRVPTATNRPGE